MASLSPSLSVGAAPTSAPIMSPLNTAQSLSPQLTTTTASVSPSNNDNISAPVSASSTPARGERPKSKDYNNSGSKESSTPHRGRSQSDDFKHAGGDADKQGKRKPFLSPKLLLPGKHRTIVGDEPPISKTLDNRMKSNPYIKKFKLPSSEILIDDYSAALYRQILLHGRMYLFTNYICFESKIFGIKTMETLMIKDIISITKKRFPVGIELVLQNGQKFVFASFVLRDKTYHDMLDAWRDVTGETHEDVSSQSVDDDAEEDQMIGFDDHTSHSTNGTATDTSSSSTSISELTTSDLKSASIIGSEQQQQQQQQQQKSIANSIDNNNNNNNNKSTTSSQVDTTIPSTSSLNTNTSTTDLSKAQMNVPATQSATKPATVASPKPSAEEKSPFDELYGDIEQYLSTNEQASILESSVSEFQELLVENFNISVVNFFRVLCSDQCNFAHTYHAKRGDSNIVVKNWTHRERFGTVRELEYVAPVNSPIGPDKTRIQETQRYHLTNKKLAVETDTIMLDIPYGDHFRIEAKWDVVETSSETCRLSIQLCVRFIKKTWFKSKIEAGTIKESKGSFTQWVQLAKQEIQKTMQLKPKPTMITAQPSQLVLNRSIDNKKELIDSIARLKNEEQPAVSSPTLDSPKPHHLRSRSRQHLMTSSGQVSNVGSPNHSHHHTPVLHSTSTSIPIGSPQPTNIGLPVNNSSGNLSDISSSFGVPSSITASKLQQQQQKQQQQQQHTKEEIPLGFKLKLSTKYGSLTLSGFILVAMLLLAISMYMYMHLQVVSLRSKMETIEDILKDVVKSRVVAGQHAHASVGGEHGSGNTATILHPS
ncbi:hypothetical protein SAMD00019534_052490 [Acytostelium subglobosum LB1]|uniref:hypothetical protein n=1 Tax=Acytostelium subglobosum LB1 TaxID=1410327 RepID=UPI0006451F5C|nr:hypothetical protein SAMD00019534_052490 [Acytostelium subglobosum LB1]GAM22074.1 hypothetical protein SAMD00019534_052490 [Acytostelium subglobosum LB1]|eukprot:XP_012755174.1 hypothetical protein SAMD00019534_052490 [Acytostelium subglobosum LB1]